MKITRAQIFIITAALILVGIASVFIRDAQTPRTPVAEPLTQTFDKSPGGFTLKYPEDWEYSIPTVGLFLLAPQETMRDNAPGPTLTVQRTEPLSVIGTLDDAIIGYLNTGPLKTPGNWRVTDPIHAVQFQGRDARMVDVEGANSSASPLMHSRIIVTNSDNTFVYFFITLAPADKQAAAQPTFDAMLATVQILE